jgi:hypothetical protein
MGKTATKHGSRPPEFQSVTVTRSTPAGIGTIILKALTIAGSLRITVVLFALSILLVFFGTLAQVDEGLITVLNNYFRTGIAWIPRQVFLRFGQTFFGASQGETWAGRFPFPGGWLLGSLLLVNLLAAHTAMTWRLIAGYGISEKLRNALLKRTGIFVLHGGVVLLMLGELITGVFAVESRMTITEGESANYVEDFHKVELAVVDASAPETDDVVVVPGSRLRKLSQGNWLGDANLPFDVSVVRYMVNSAIPEQMPPGITNPATAGTGRSLVAIEEPEIRGTDSMIDLPSAYVTLKKRGTNDVLGTYLVSTHLRPQPVVVDGKRYDVALRFKRTYKPFALHLVKFKVDRYPGTDLAKEYSSKVRLVDPERHEDREVVICMNEPLRYRGDTFYQADFDKRTEKTTVLQVVRNPGWLMPYIACIMVALGMLVHFSLHLVGFLKRVVR